MGFRRDLSIRCPVQDCRQLRVRTLIVRNYSADGHCVIPPLTWIRELAERLWSADLRGSVQVLP